jgi:hypothetical protein
MDGALHQVLAVWGNFYLITGSAAAALTGLQFVVQTLVASGLHRSPESPDPMDGIGAFGSPTVVHFTLALILSALLCVPWPGEGALRLTLGTVGCGALIYAGVVLRRARRQRTYHPVAEDWIWHVVLPAAAYLAVLVAALRFGTSPGWPEFAIAAATLLLLCVGIHNAWDTVTYLTSAVLRHGPAASAPAAARKPARGRRR